MKPERKHQDVNNVWLLQLWVFLLVTALVRSRLSKIHQDDWNATWAETSRFHFCMTFATLRIPAGSTTVLKPTKQTSPRWLKCTLSGNLRISLLYDFCNFEYSCWFHHCFEADEAGCTKQDALLVKLASPVSEEWLNQEEYANSRKSVKSDESGFPCKVWSRRLRRSRLRRLRHGGGTAGSRKVPDVTWK